MNDNDNDNNNIITSIIHLKRQSKKEKPTAKIQQLSTKLSNT